MQGLIAASAIFAFGVQEPVHRPDGAVIPAMVEQRSIGLCGRTVLKALFMETRQNGRFLFAFQTARTTAASSPVAEKDDGYGVGTCSTWKRNDPDRLVSRPPTNRVLPPRLSGVLATRNGRQRRPPIIWLPF